MVWSVNKSRGRWNSPEKGEVRGELMQERLEEPRAASPEEGLQVREGILPLCSALLASPCTAGASFGS